MICPLCHEEMSPMKGDPRPDNLLDNQECWHDARYIVYLPNTNRWTFDDNDDVIYTDEEFQRYLKMKAFW